MDVINVITVKNGLVNEVKSFKVEDNSNGLFNKDKNITAAENLFIEKAKDLGCTEEEVDAALEGGYFWGAGLNPETVSLVWSELSTNEF